MQFDASQWLTKSTDIIILRLVKKDKKAKEESNWETREITTETWKEGNHNFHELPSIINYCLPFHHFYFSFLSLSPPTPFTLFVCVMESVTANKWQISDTEKRKKVNGFQNYKRLTWSYRIYASKVSWWIMAELKAFIFSEINHKTVF